MSEITVRLMGEELIDEQVVLFNKVFGTNATRRTWIYKHYLNPLNDRSKVFGAFDGKKLIGMNAFMPMAYRCGNETIKAVQSCENCVDPMYQRKGVFTKIAKAAQEYCTNAGYDVMVGFPNENAYPGWMKVGWDCTLGMAVMYLPCKIGNLVKRKYQIPKLGIYEVVPWILLGKIRRWAAIGKDVAIEEMPVNSYVSEINEATMNDGGIIIYEKTREILNWKLNATKYFYYSAKHGNNRIANFLLEVTEDGGVKTAKILSVSGRQVAPAIFIQAFALLMDSLSREIDLIVTFTCFESGPFLLLRQLGFMTRRNKKYFIRQIITAKPVLREILSKADLWRPELIEADYTIVMSRKE
jgi:GNAT superfamily N-acetyltransferase